MMKLVTAALLGLAVALAPTGAAHVEAAVTQAARSWKLAGRYASYDAACKKADRLKKMGYETCIEKEGGYWCVYCR